MGPDTTARADGGRTRPYESARRQGQARRTRQRILDTATAEFSSRGYAATTVAAIAAAAGVSVPTIEQVFRTKANLLKAAIDVAIAGDDEPVPVLQRPAAMTAAAAPTADTFLAAISAGIADVAERAAGLVLVAFEAAAGDPRLQPLAEQLRDNRAALAGWIVDGLAARAPLRPGLDRSRAVDVVWLLMDPAVFTRLTIDRSWSRQQFQQWFADSTARLLTDDPGRPAGGSCSLAGLPGPGGPGLGLLTSFASVGPLYLQAAQSPGHRVERRPGRTRPQRAQEFFSESPPARKLVAMVPAPRCDHRENKLPALVKQSLVNARVELADRLGNMGEIELDGSTAARLKVDEQRAVPRAEHIAWMRLAVEQLLHGAAVLDRPSQAS